MSREPWEAVIPFSYAGIWVAMNESVEVRVARLEENMKFLVEEAKEAKNARKVQYQTDEATKTVLQSMGISMQAVESKLAGQAPTIEEFITIKHKVVGAGKLGQWLWVVGAALLGFVYGARESIGNFLTRI